MSTSHYTRSMVAIILAFALTVSPLQALQISGDGPPIGRFSISTQDIPEMRSLKPNDHVLYVDARSGKIWDIQVHSAECSATGNCGLTYYKVSPLETSGPATDSPQRGVDAGTAGGVDAGRAGSAAVGAGIVAGVMEGVNSSEVMERYRESTAKMAEAWSRYNQGLEEYRSAAMEGQIQAVKSGKLASEKLADFAKRLAAGNPFDPGSPSEMFAIAIRDFDSDYKTRAMATRETLLSHAPKNDVDREKVSIGHAALRSSVEDRAAGNIQDSDISLNIAETMADLLVGLDPVTGFGRASFEFISGKNLVTGEELSTVERGLAGAGVVLGAVTFGVGASAINALRPTLKILSHLRGSKWVLSNGSRLINLSNDIFKESLAVGTTTWKRLNSAARRVAKLPPGQKEELARDITQIFRDSADGPLNRAAFQNQKRNYIRDMERPLVKHPLLSKIADDIYKNGGTIGNGSTAAAIRFERATGLPVKGRLHTTEGGKRLNRLMKWYKEHPTASPGDRAACENMMMDLMDALYSDY